MRLSSRFFWAALVRLNVNMGDCRPRRPRFARLAGGGDAPREKSRAIDDFQPLLLAAARNAFFDRLEHFDRKKAEGKYARLIARDETQIVAGPDEAVEFAGDNPRGFVIEFKPTSLPRAAVRARRGRPLAFDA